MDFSQVKNIKIPSDSWGSINVVNIKDAANHVLWKTGPIELLSQPETITHAIGTFPTSYVRIPRDVFWANKSEFEITLTLPSELTFESGVDTVTKYRILTSIGTKPSYEYHDPGTITVKPEYNSTLGIYIIEIQPIKTLGDRAINDIFLVGAQIVISSDAQSYYYRNNIEISFEVLSITAVHADKPDITFTIESIKYTPTVS